MKFLFMSILLLGVGIGVAGCEDDDDDSAQAVEAQEGHDGDGNGESAVTKYDFEFNGTIIYWQGYEPDPINPEFRYGIQADDGTRYYPMDPLPGEFNTEGLKVSVWANDANMGGFYGTVIDIVEIRRR